MGYNLLIFLKGLDLVTGGAGDMAAEETRVGMYSSIANIATQVDEMTSDHVGRYMLHSCTTPIVNEMDPFYDPYIHYELSLLAEITRLPEDHLRQMSSYLVGDLVDSYQALYTLHGITPQ